MKTNLFFEIGAALGGDERMRFTFMHECAHVVVRRWPGYRTCEALLGIKHRRRRRRQSKAPPRLHLEALLDPSQAGKENL